jgi:hypothetical protein
LIACLLGGGRARGGRGTLSPGTTGAGQRLLAGVAFVNMSREQITELKERQYINPLVETIKKTAAPLWGLLKGPGGRDTNSRDNPEIQNTDLLAN